MRARRSNRVCYVTQRASKDTDRSHTTRRREPSVGGEEEDDDEEEEEEGNYRE